MGAIFLNIYFRESRLEISAERNVLFSGILSPIGLGGNGTANDRIDEQGMMPMTKSNIPAWAMRTATAEDYGIVQDSHSRGTMQVRWPDLSTLRRWTKLHGWPTPWFGYETAFLAKMFESPITFTQAIDESGVEIQIPQPEYTLSDARLQEFDSLYAQRSPSGQPLSWGTLVEDLRELRRAVEAGVVVQVEDGQRIQTWQEFYAWAHGRYHMLEDGYDRWIGDDN